MPDVHVHYTFESAGLSGGCEVSAVRLIESLNEPYRLHVTLELEDPDAALEPLLAADCVLSMTRMGHTRRLVGLARHIEEGEHSADAQSVELVVVPALWMLGLRRNTRIFQEMTVPEILGDVLGGSLKPYGRAHELDLKDTYPKREYCVQYQESDLDFVQRLMEEHGIHYAFDHEGEQELLLLRDKNASYEPVPSGEAIKYRPHNLQLADEEPIIRFRLRHHDRTTSVKLRDWDWTRTDMLVEGEHRSLDELQRDRESYEQGAGRSLQLWDYDAGRRAYGNVNVDRQALIRQQELARDVCVGHGVSAVVQMAPGTTFSLVDHPTPGFDGDYLITRVEHASQQLSAAVPGAADDDPYFNRFECIPLATEYRPERRTKKPRIAGVQTAVVTGPSGEEIHTDEHGRIKVQFHWDREGKFDESSSCWIRVQQAWAGEGWGFWWLPRIGMEVVVHFVDGDPDRPLVTGSVYNANNLPPYPLPDEKTKSTIKSNSTIGGGGSNELRFEDKASSEEIYTHAEKDYNEVVENDHNTLVHHDQFITVDRHQTQHVKNNQTETVNHDQTLTVDGDRTLHVKTNYDETVDGTETRHVVQDVTETLCANETREVKGNLTESITGNETRKVGGNFEETIGVDHTLDLTGNMTHTITGALTQTVTGGITQTTPAAYAVTAVGGLTITAPGGATLTAAGPISIAAPAGVQMVGSKWDWIGLQANGYSGYSASVTLSKIEAAGAIFAVVGFKCEVPLVHFQHAFTEMKTHGLAVAAPLTYLKFGALKCSVGPTSKI
ncbi:MAG: type VI secretion system Vgr family protein [Sandaracinaceae bacterium]